jgi:hypothetical protein
MKKLLSPVFTIALCFASCHDHGMHAAALAQDSEPAKIAGKWQMSMESPHGAVKGPFQVQQDGAKRRFAGSLLTATVERCVAGHQRNVV